MQIIVTPSDIIQRCIWDKYRKFCLHDKTEEEVKKIVEDNKPVSLSEEDAYVVGLLRIIETDNLIHRFNENVLDVLQIKSNVFKDELYINKSSMLKEISTYFLKFPDYYKPPFNYKQALDELRIYVKMVEGKVLELEVTNVKQREKIFIYYKSKDIKKCLDI